MMSKTHSVLHRVVKILGAVSIISSLFASSLMAEEAYPSKPINLVVGFGIGGSADRMTRAMTSSLSEALNAQIQVINKPGASSQIGANYVLSKPNDGYTIFSSGFAPYLANTILTGGAKYKISDFDYLNIQWFDYDLIAANKDTEYKSLGAILKDIKEHPKKVKAAVVQGSSGHLLLKLIFEKYGIPAENVNLVTYSSGGDARSAVAGGQVDFIAISAEGCESISEFLTPVAIFNDERIPSWDVPTVNEALKKELGFEIPMFSGAMRGFAVRAGLKEQHPDRYKILVDGIKTALENKETQKLLNDSQIGGVWTGPEKANALLNQSFEVYKQYGYLLKK